MGAVELSLEKRLLIVDDEKNLRLTLAEILRGEGYQVDVAECGESAISLCEENTYEVALIDLRMPGINGVDTLRKIREHQTETRIFMMSAFADEGLGHQSMELGAIGVLDKPLDIVRVVELVTQVRDIAVLVVESDPAVRIPIEENLQALGCRISHSADRESTLNLVEQLQFDLILMDVDLPGANGLGLFHTVKQRLPEAVVVMISDLSEMNQKLANEAVRISAHSIVNKPCDLPSVVALVGQLIDEHALDFCRKFS